MNSKKNKMKKNHTIDNERWNHLESYQEKTLGVLEKSGSDDNGEQGQTTVYQIPDKCWKKLTTQESNLEKNIFEGKNKDEIMIQLDKRKLKDCVIL